MGEIEDLIKKRYELFKKAIKAEVDTWFNEEVHIKRHKLDMKFPFIQESNLYFGERQIIITLNLSKGIYNTDELLNEIDIQEVE